MADLDPSDDDGATDRWGELGSFIRDQRRTTHLSLRKLAELAGVSNPYLSQIERGLRKPSAEILQQIARALSISAESLYVRAGILEEREGMVDVVGEIRRDSALSADQRQALIRIYQSFRAEAGAPLDEVDSPDPESSDDPER
ncbi:helix-turn-helix domain-containing protein [Actinospongicola halichondriae]|uniref:helix-turn-helix domain-containing protein n=1 Tax=Actinospongicola halichondriae TaxID=3236844 RepID=UPI003D4BABF8